MNAIKPSLPAEAGGTDITRFNALRHGVLSRYTVLPWEDADEYGALVGALVCSATIWMEALRRTGRPIWRSRRGDDCRAATVTQAIFS